MFTLDDLDRAAAVVHAAMPPTPQYAWPVLAARLGCRVVVKHENHTPIGAFKVRGGLVYVERLRRERPHVRGIVSATRGNHGQSLALAGRRFGLPVAIVVPHGNSIEKNEAMRAFGAELVEHGRDFDDARQHAAGSPRSAGSSSSRPFTRTSSPASRPMRANGSPPSPTSTWSMPRSASARASAASSAPAIFSGSRRRSSASCRKPRTPTACRSTPGRWCRSTAPTPSPTVRPSACPIRLRCPSSSEARRQGRRSDRGRDRRRGASPSRGHAQSGGGRRCPRARGAHRSRSRYEGRSAGVVLSGGNVDRG